jgi:hypothetical protein
VNLSTGDALKRQATRSLRANVAARQRLTISSVPVFEVAQGQRSSQDKPPRIASGDQGPHLQGFSQSRAAPNTQAQGVSLVSRFLDEADRVRGSYLILELVLMHRPLAWIASWCV